MANEIISGSNGGCDQCFAENRDHRTRPTAVFTIEYGDGTLRHCSLCVDCLHRGGVLLEGQIVQAMLESLPAMPK